MVQLTLLPMFDAFNRVLMCRDTFLSHIVREGLSLAVYEPLLLKYLQDDIERAAREAKKERLMDKVYRAEQLPRFPAFVDRIEPEDFDSVDSRNFDLCDGRPRIIDAELLLVLTVINGAISLTSRAGYERLVESEVFGAIIQGKNIKMPSRSTIGKYLQITSERTLNYIHEVLLRKVREEGLDDFSELTVDSTGIEANSAWPTESGLIFGFLTRIHKLLTRQADYTDVEYSSKLVDRWLQQIEQLHKKIQILPARPGSRIERRKLYGSLLKLAEKTRDKLRELFDRRTEEIESCCILPSHRTRTNLIIGRIEESFDEVNKAVSSAQLRILTGKSTPACEKAFSLADPDAYMIKKGGREPLLGYKPQLGRSGNGFISCFEVERGNPADYTRLEAMVLKQQALTSVVPTTVSTDDGYSSAHNLTVLKEMKVERVSFSGAKGRTVLGDEIWQMPEYQKLRNDRSAVESTIFTFKHKCNMRRFCRHGIDGVRKDLSEAVLAFNLWRMSYVRKQKREKDDYDLVTTAA